MSESRTEENSLEEEKERVIRELLECLEEVNAVATYMSNLINHEETKRRQFETDFSRLNELLNKALEIAVQKKESARR